MEAKETDLVPDEKEDRSGGVRMLLSVSSLSLVWLYCADASCPLCRFVLSKVSVTFCYVSNLKCFRLAQTKTPVKNMFKNVANRILVWSARAD